MDTTGSSSDTSPEPGSPMSMEPLKGDAQPSSNNRWRNLVGYWILGLCNNYGYVVMLSAAHDILAQEDGGHNSANSSSTMVKNAERDCNTMSTGAILLADIIPALIIKLLAPFLPFCVHIRIAVSVIFQAAGFLMVALSKTQLLAIFGVVATSFASGLGEVTFLSYTTYFKEKVISTWSSGTGGAGVIGALSYAGLTTAGLSPSTALLLMLIVPALESVVFMFLLKHPGNTSVCSPPTEEELRSIMETLSPTPTEPISNVRLTFQDKLRIVPSLLLKYMIPLGLVYLFEYFINQGIFELVFFPDFWLNHEEQYRWLQVDYQIGVFISRSSLHFFQFPWLWLLAILQGINVIFFTLQVVYSFSPSIWIIFAAVLWEGLLGGASYVNTFHRVSQEAPPDRKEFSVAVVCMSDSFGIGLAGIIAIPVHNILCELPLYI